MPKPTPLIQVPTITTFLTPLLSIFHPLVDALTLPDLPFHIRLRLLLFQPLTLLTDLLLTHIPCHLLSAHPPSTIYIPVRNGRTLRTLAWFPPPPSSSSSSPLTNLPHKPPIHITLHPGAFIAGTPEATFRLATYLSRRNHQQPSADNFIVLAPSYRLAPRYAFPAALQDVEDVVDWVTRNAEMLGADAERVTVSGFSAGGNLGLAAALRLDHDDQDNSSVSAGKLSKKIKGVVTFYAPIDLTIPSSLKPRSGAFPESEPLAIFLPLYDLYASSGRRTGHTSNPQLSPCLADALQLPRKLLMVVAGVDVLVKESLDFVGRINGDKGSQRIEMMVMEGCWHGWLELPSMFIDESTRTRVFERCAEFLRSANEDGKE